MTVIATSTTSLAFEVRLLHASTGKVIDRIAIGPTAWSPGWSARVIAGTVAVSRSTFATSLAPGHIDVTVTDPLLAAHLDFPPGPAGGNTIRVPLTGPVNEVAVNPTAMVLTVVLVTEGSGAPSVGKTLAVHPSTGADVPLSAVPGSPGTYASAPRVWGAPFTPADLKIGSTTVRKVSLDFTRAQTRINVVDPT